MSSIAEAWARLGIPATDDKREVKRAYGRALKQIDPETDPQAFLELREAYDAALQWGTSTPYWEEDVFEDMIFAGTGGEEGTEPADFETADSERAGFETADEDWWERWRPEPPASADDEGLREACARLDRLLFDDPPPPPAEIVEAGRSVMDHPGLAEVDRLTETENWMAEAISAAVPRSDPLIEPAIARFGWTQAAGGWRRHFQVDSVLGRRDDLFFLERCRRPGEEHFLAVKALTEPPPGKLKLTRLRLAADVGAFLDVIAAEHPTLDRDLDPDSLAWWRDYLHGRHLPPNFVVWMSVMPAALTFAAGFAFASRGWPLWFLVPVFIVAALATWGALLGKAELDYRARRRQSGSWEDGVPRTPWIERLAAAALVLPPLAALLPNGTLGTSLSIVASLALAAAGRRLGWVEPGWETNERVRLFLPVVAGLLGATILGQGSVEEAVKLCAPLLALSYLGSRLHAPMVARSLAWPSAAGPAVLAGSLAFILVAGALASRAGLGEAAPLWALLLVPSAIVGGHFAAAASTAEVHFIEWPLRIVGVAIYFGSGLFVGYDSVLPRLTPAISAYALLYAGSLVVSALIIERRRRRSEEA